MMDHSTALPTDIEELHRLIRAERTMLASVLSERDQLAVRTAKLERILAEIRRAHFGRKSERIDDAQLALALEDLEAALARNEAKDEKTDGALKLQRTQKRRASRVLKFDHLPHEEVVIEPESTSCPCCGGALHVIGEDTSRRLDKIPARVRVIVTRRPKYACRTCTDGVVQAPAPPRLVEGGLPTEAFVADVVVSKHADHQPLYRQSQILARHDVPIERSTLAQWVGAGTAELEALYNHLVRSLKSSAKLFADETRCPVLDPGRGKTKSGYLWAIARDDRPWGGTAPPAIAYSYAPGRGGEHAITLVAGFAGVLQVDGYAVYKQLAGVKGLGEAVALAFCWAHVRRKFYEIYVGGNAPIAAEALVRIRKLYAIEAEIRGGAPEVRRSQRQARSKPIVDA